MSIVRRISRLSRLVQFALVAVAAFAIGSATVVAAATAGIPVGSLFYLPLINGFPTTPCSTVPATTTTGATTTCNAIVDSNGDLHVAGSSTVSGAVSVNNFPADQQVHGTVGINNLPGTQAVNGTVNVGNLPANQVVTGTVNVGNLPGTQTVHVDNVPATQNVNIVGGGVTASAPVATKAVTLWGHLDSVLSGGKFAIIIPININATYITIKGCDSYTYDLAGGGVQNGLEFTTQGNFPFPTPLNVTSVVIRNDNGTNGCNYSTTLVGY